MVNFSIHTVVTTYRDLAQMCGLDEIRLKSLPKMESCWDRAKCGPRGERVMDDIANIGYGYEREFCSLSDYTI